MRAPIMMILLPQENAALPVYARDAAVNRFSHPFEMAVATVFGPLFVALLSASLEADNSFRRGCSTLENLAADTCVCITIAPRMGSVEGGFRHE